ncbi:type II toxin-antitoxin system RelB/DinJ family antitoxin [Bifidobacterium callimiconis]|uniref:RelB/DinJ family addiction module antitoxin n=1 Tax=Bifidobacterium callimiconis TaxID=2306973 RepID=A0A430FBW3_9BIFI|nr:type II toxin-antitoxin system RelB/DinJ family antitoxin [Bifidobacterium callimiconis]RSX50335.1 RelB/DinJ family addiction module antitoxin [Bifidobacterium callimiconis]
MTMTTINIRIDDQTKKSMNEVCDELGISMSAAFNVFARTVARERRIPFELNADPFYSRDNIAYLRRAADRMDHGSGHTHDLIED